MYKHLSQWHKNFIFGIFVTTMFLFIFDSNILYVRCTSVMNNNLKKKNYYKILKTDISYIQKNKK